MFDPELKAFLESGCALIVGTVGADGVPGATRGWGLDVLEREGGDLPCVRLLLDADDPVVRCNLTGGGAVAITGTDVPTLRSVQLKGHTVALEPAGAADEQRMARFRDEFFSDVTATDGTSSRLLERLVPLHLAACIVHVDQLFDQTPGPGAGAAIEPDPVVTEP